VDPIYYQVNQTRLTEVTQKTSDNLRLQGNKEARRKAEKAGDVDKSALSGDSSSMSDDMLGDMDPDDYGGRGAKQFAQMWKEQMEEDEEEEEPSEEEGEEEEEPSEPEDKAAPNKEESEIESQVQEESPVAGSSPTPPPASGQVAENSNPAKEPAPAAPVQATAAKEPRPAERAPVTPPTSAAEARKQDPKASAVEKFQGSPPAAAAAEARVGAPAKKSSLGSLLDFSSGYLIAEEAHWDPDAPEEALPEEAETAEATVPEELSILLERLVIGDASQPGFRKLNQLLSRFGRRVLRQCIEVQAKIYLLPPGEPLLAHPQLANCGHADLQGAAYLPNQRICLVEDDCVSRAPRGFHPVFYYFAHLWDHAMGGEKFASSKSAAVNASYQLCLDGGHRFGDLMSSHSAAHYFAQAVESYLAENDCFEPLWTRQDLYDFDRSIYDYIEYLLK
jgi:hypothetical protein